MKAPKNIKILFQIRFGKRTFFNIAASGSESFWFAPVGLTFSKKTESWIIIAGILMLRLSVVHFFQDKPKENKEERFSPYSIRNNATIKRRCRKNKR